MSGIETTILSKVLDWVPVAISGALLFVLRKLFKHDETLSSHDTSIALQKQHAEAEVSRRNEDRRLRDQQRREIMNKIDQQHNQYLDMHKEVMAELKSLREQ